MKNHYFKSIRFLASSALLLGVSASVLMSQEKQKKDENQDDCFIELSPFSVSTGGSMGVTVGGSKNSSYFRDVVRHGGFPHPSTLTAEGLFSEYDLPLKQHRQSKDLLVLNGEAIATTLVTAPETRYLAQIGFSSGIDASTWHRDPINLVAVVDKSGSMNGRPLELVKQCLRQILSQFGPEDQLSIVLYGDRAHVFLAPTHTSPENTGKIEEAIETIVSCGSTNMEAGLKVGFDLARQSQETFHGRTRLMQFTDERPNVGDTSAAGFMGLMQAGSRDGIGQTTIGVGEQFGAEMAARVSAVRGGNLLFFADAEEMTKAFEEDLDTMVTELAYDLDVFIQPAAGLKITGVYGIPGEMLTYAANGAVRFHVSTLFLSHRKGAIYIAFAPAEENLPAPHVSTATSLASVSLSYSLLGHDTATQSSIELPLLTKKEASKGLSRGVYLVNEYVGLKAAMDAHLIENNQEKAFGILTALQQKLGETHEWKLRKEQSLVETLCLRMAKLSGHGEPESGRDDGRMISDTSE